MYYRFTWYIYLMSPILLLLISVISFQVGLWSFMEEFHWFHQSNVSKTVTPKTFRVTNKNEMDMFVKEFGLSACVALLKIIVNQVATAESDSFFRNGMVGSQFDLLIQSIIRHIVYAVKCYHLKIIIFN